MMKSIDVNVNPGGFLIGHQITLAQYLEEWERQYYIPNEGIDVETVSFTSSGGNSDYIRRYEEFELNDSGLTLYDHDAVNFHFDLNTVGTMLGEKVGLEGSFDYFSFQLENGDVIEFRPF